ncbi:MAG: primosomal protein N' [Acholeplasmatales bacterium]|nr:primosomal protein N' [Acholeplasmatales bacterium]
MFADIVVDIKNKQVNRTYSYLIPSHLENIIKIGHRVLVPFGNLKRCGYVVDIKEFSCVSKVKEIIDIIDVKNILNEEFVDIAKYIALENFTFYSKAFDCMIPSILKIKYQKVAKIINKELLDDNLKDIFKNKKEISIEKLDIEKQKILYKAYSNNLILIENKAKRRKDDDIIKMVHLNDYDKVYRSNSKKLLLSYLSEIDTDIELDLLIESGYKKNIINELVSDGILSIYDKVINHYEYKDYEIEDNFELNNEQQEVFNQIKYDKYNTYLLHGITGSGKTMVYIKCISEVLKNNKNAIMLVPEISLTPQITSILHSVFKNNIAILHSKLSPKEKYNEWKRIIDKKTRIVVGARSAIFAPLKDLGLIIIDEAHEESYKQLNNPKYNAKEIAELRAKKYNIPIILGTATPDISDYYKATSGEYELLEIKNRANNKPLPKVEVVDLKEELKCGNKSVLSKKLQNELTYCLDNNNQAILFLNRRGHSTFVQCRSCGEVIKCPHCDISLTYHMKGNYLKCHQCGYQIVNVSTCPKCQSDKIRYVGTGTEKIYDEVSKMFPLAKILRCDTDSINSLKDYEEIYNKFKNHEADILIGTQMITKGLDFKDCTLVGVLNADLSINFPKYDSNQISFNLIEQVSGRSGRSDKEGKVIIQTYMPNHFVIRCSKNHDYDSYFNEEIQNRRLADLPPFSVLIEIMVSSLNKDIAYDNAQKIIRYLSTNNEKSIILGPTEDYIFKKCDKYRYVIQIYAKDDLILDKIKYIYPEYQTNKDCEIEITRM